MPWLVSFLISWVCFSLLADLRRPAVLLVGGLGAVAVQLFTDYLGQQLGHYRVLDPLIPLWGSSAFFTFGPVFTMGALFGQYLPAARWLQGVHIAAFGVLLLLEEHMFMLVGVLEYTNHWSHPASFLINILAMSALAWLAESQRLGWQAPRRRAGALD